MGVLYDFLFSLSALREKHPALLRELRLSFTQDSSEDMPYCEEFSSYSLVSPCAYGGCNCGGSK